MVILAYPWPLVMTVFFGLLTLAAESAQQRRLAAASKVLASLGFVLGAASSPLVNSTYGHRILAGALLAWTGDLMFLGRGRWPLLLGIVTFLVSKVCYMQAMLLWGFGPINLGCFFLALLAPTSVIRAWLWPHVPQSLRMPTLCYLVASALFVACTLAAAPNHPRPLMAVNGALLFVASDIFVAKERFIKKSVTNAWFGMPLYWTAQWLLISTAGIG
jgi:uncharacterized membrane protein YhhN